MDEALGYLEVARVEDTVYARVIGLGVASVGIDFWDFTEEMVRQGFRRFIVDLSHCRSMDSTFMGVLVGIAESPEVTRDDAILVINPSDHHLKLMEGLGLPKIISIKDGKTGLPDIEMKRLESFPRTAEERIRRIRDVHVKLVALDERNQEKFRSFLKILNQELQEK
jgi:hypothetical protein